MSFGMDLRFGVSEKKKSCVKRNNQSSVKLQTLAKGLGPSFVRFGGTDQDVLTFNGTVGVGSGLKRGRATLKQTYTMTVAEWDKINKFVSDVGWHLVFGLNILLRNEQAWDPTNAVSLMKYSDQKGYKLDLELGNEPDLFEHVFKRTIDPSQSGRDFGVLRRLMKTFPAFKSSLLIGPDVTRPIKTSDANNLSISSVEYLKRFLKTGSEHLDVVTFHHYYVRSQTATAQDFIDPDILDSLQGQITLAQSIINVTCRKGKQLWLGEAGSSSGRGAPNISDRYIAGFMWLDRLGLSAVYGVNVVIRQSFYKGHYAMIDRLNYTPFPDYWLTLLYKQLVGQRVLQAMTNTSSNKIRLYAHCTNTDDSSVSLNGHLLEMKSESELPVLEPKIQSGHLPVDIKALTFGFIVIPQINFQTNYLTQQYYRKYESLGEIYMYVKEDAVEMKCLLRQEKY